MAEERRRFTRKRSIALCRFLPVLLLAETGLAQGDEGLSNPGPAANLIRNPGFEIMQPGYWESLGSGAEWTNVTSRSPDWSLSLSGSGKASWQQNEAIRSWITRFPEVGNPVFEVGAWVKLVDANSNPASDDERFQLVFEFFEDASRTDYVLGAPIVLDLPQGRPSTDGWVEIVSDPIAFPAGKTSKSVRVTFLKGARTMGAAFLDDLFIRDIDPSGGEWVGNFFNPNLDAGAYWYYWWNKYSEGDADWPASQAHYVTVSSEEAHSGGHSLKIEANGSNPFEAVAVSERVPIEENEPLLLSFWVKYLEYTDRQAIGTGLNNLGVTALWFGNGTGFGVIQGIDIVLDGELDDRLVPRLEGPGEWLRFAFVLYPPRGATSMEVRPRYWPEFQGVTYWDDFFVAPVTDVLGD